MKNTFYAVQMNREDNDWGTGSYDLEEAKNMARRMDEEARIAVIDMEGQTCIEEIEQEDF